jgi:hypothetical protein
MIIRGLVHIDALVLVRFCFVFSNGNGSPFWGEPLGVADEMSS